MTNLTDFMYNPKSFDYLKTKLDCFVEYLDTKEFELIKDHLSERIHFSYFEDFLSSLSYSEHLKLDKNIVNYLKKTGVQGFYDLISKLMFEDSDRTYLYIRFANYLIQANIQVTSKELYEIGFVSSYLNVFRNIICSEQHVILSNLHIRLDIIIKHPELLSTYVKNVAPNEEELQDVVLYLEILLGDDFNYDFSEINKQLYYLHKATNRVFLTLRNKSNLHLEEVSYFSKEILEEFLETAKEAVN